MYKFSPYLHISKPYSDKCFQEILDGKKYTDIYNQLKQKKTRREKKEELRRILIKKFHEEGYLFFEC